MILFIDDAASGGRPTVTWNPADKGSNISLSSGNLYVNIGGTGFNSVRATYGIPHTESGYFELLIGNGGPPVVYMINGIALLTASLAGHLAAGSDGWGYYQETGEKVTAGAGAAYGAAYSTSDVIGVAFKNGSVWFSKNGTWQNSGDPAANTGAAFTGITGTVYPAVSPYYFEHQIVGRFKTADFTYSPPSGFEPWGT